MEARTRAKVQAWSWRRYRGLASRLGALGWRKGTEDEDRNGEHDITGRQQSRAQAVVAF